jgi:hypothetical protein
MAKRVSSIVAMMSLAICLAALVAGVASYFATVPVYHSTAGPSEFQSHVRDGWFRNNFFAAGRASTDVFIVESTAGSVPLVSITRSRSKNVSSRTLLSVHVSIWLIAFLSALPPVVLRISGRRGRLQRRRAARGLCVVCGYDLRGSAERCPECGTAIAVEKSV